MAEIAVGIDLGTSNSCVAVARGQKVEVLPNAYGENVTPSVVAFKEDGAVVVGNAARAHVIHAPKHTVTSAKRLIGRYFFSEEVRKAQAVCSYSIVEGPDHSVRIQVRNEQFSLPEISAMILREIKSIAEERLGQPVEKAVITVPAYFNDNQRQATKDAGRIAGLEILRLLNEPTAAALCYGFGRGLNQRVAVYDLGGGTFDVSILEIGKDVFEVLSTCGDTYLGGDDFDDRIIDLLADEFMQREDINLRSDPYALEKLKMAAEAAKRGFSVEDQVEIRIPDVITGKDGQPRSLQRVIARQEFASLVMDLVQRTFKVCDEALQQANLVVRDLDGVILVGGPTRLPLVRQAVRDYFQQEPRADVDPDEVVAMGAAIHAASLTSTAPSEAFLLDVTPLSLRIGVAGGLAETVIERNTPVPIEQTRAFTTYRDSQASVKIRVYQGESRQAEENELLGQFEFSGLRKARRGEVRIDVTFEIDSDGIVKVTARDPESGRHASTRITLSSGLSATEIDQIIQAGRTDRVRREATPPVPPTPSGAAPKSASVPPVPLAPTFGDDEPGDELQVLDDGDGWQARDDELPPPGETAIVTPRGAPPEPVATSRDDAPRGPAAGAPAEEEIELRARDLADLPVGGPEAPDPGAHAPDHGIELSDLSGSPDDEISLQSGAESLFEIGGGDLSHLPGEEEER